MVVDWLTVAAACAVMTVLVMTSVAVVIRRLGRVAVMDVLWGPLILLNSVTAAVTGLVVGSTGPVVWVMLAVVVLWAGRLSRHLLTRSGSDREDPRYDELMRKPASTLVTSVLLPQGSVGWLVSVPVQVAAVAGGDAMWPVVVVGTVLAVAGLVVESVADRQLDDFRAEGVSGRVMDRGLWSWSRHPNYFGESLVWWGIWVAAAASGAGVTAILLSLVSPVAMTVTLVWGTGARLLEKRMEGRDGWSDYRRRTSMFIPLPPRRSGTEDYFSPDQSDGHSSPNSR